MYTGSFTPLGVCVLSVLLPSLNLSGERYQLSQFFCLPVYVGLFAHVSYGDATQYVFDSLIHLLQRLADGAQIALLAIAMNGHTGSDEQRTINSPYHFIRADAFRIARQNISAMRSVLRLQQPGFHQSLQNLGQQFLRNTVLARNILGAACPTVSVLGEVLHRH